MGRVRRLLVAARSLPAVCWLNPSTYDPDLPAVHVIAKQLNRCPRFLDAATHAVAGRYIAKACGTGTRRCAGQFRWGYDRAAQGQRTLWVSTRACTTTSSNSAEMSSAREMNDHSDLGYITNYLQNMTSPAHVVPVYFTRWWRWPFVSRLSDRQAMEKAMSIGAGAARIARTAGRRRRRERLRAVQSHRQPAGDVAGVLEAGGRSGTVRRIRSAGKTSAAA